MMEISNCCGAPRWSETDICQQCKEHADFYEEIEVEDTTINFKTEAEIMCKLLELPNKTHRDYLANKLEMMYVKGKYDITKEFKQMRGDDE